MKRRIRRMLFLIVIDIYLILQLMTIMRGTPRDQHIQQAYAQYGTMTIGENTCFRPTPNQRVSPEYLAALWVFTPTLLLPPGSPDCAAYLP
jgi:hypothetical protein